MIVYLNLAKAELSSLMAALVTACPTAWLICCRMCGGIWFIAAPAAPALPPPPPGLLSLYLVSVQLYKKTNKINIHDKCTGIITNRTFNKSKKYFENTSNKIKRGNLWKLFVHSSVTYSGNTLINSQFVYLFTFN